MINWFKKKTINEVKYLIVGLGNIGEEYRNTRHNIGFDVVDKWADQIGATFDLARLSFCARAKFKGRTLVMIKPTTYMNLSGKAVKYWMSTEKIPIDRILIITDDLALPLAKIRLKTKGSHAGHNGLKDIITQLGTDEFARIKFGIGDDFPRGRQVEHVLGKWNDNENLAVDLGIDKACELIEAFLTEGAQASMNKFN